MSVFVEKAFEPPEHARLGKYVLHPLSPSDVEVDCNAVNENAALIRRTRGGTWPQGPITLDEDLGDLQEHQRQFGEREAFAYVVEHAGNGEYAGCLYIYPPHHPFDDTDKSSMPENADAAVSFWVTQAAYDAGVYGDLCRLVPDWLQEAWPFQNPYIANQQKV